MIYGKSFEERTLSFQHDVFPRDSWNLGRRLAGNEAKVFEDARILRKKTDAANDGLKAKKGVADESKFAMKEQPRATT